MQVGRGELLQVLESLQPGLTVRDVVEQSSCFCFKDGEAITFNDEIACRRKSPLKIEGAVQALPLINILRRLPEEEVEIFVEDGQLIVKGKRRRAGIRMQSDVSLPIEKVEEADEWQALHEDFTDAVYVAQQCVGKDSSNYTGTCIHIHTKYVEACDNKQAVRYRIKTRVKEPILVRGSSLKNIISLDMTEFAETETWIHFRNPTGLVMSCRRDIQEFDDLSAVLTLDGAELTLPKGIGEAAAKAEVFSSENTDDNEVLIRIRPGQIKVQGEGASGWYQEFQKTNYDGDEISFRIAPKLLGELVKRYSDCLITESRLYVDTGKFVYVVALGKTDGEDEPPAEVETTEE